MATSSSPRTWRFFMLVWTVVLIVNLVALMLLVISGDVWWKFLVPAVLVVVSVSWLIFSSRQLSRPR